MRFFALLARRARRTRPAAPRARLVVEALESRIVPYSTSGSLWAHPNLVTISFMPDGTNLGGVTSNLFATFNSKFGSAAAWQAQILKAAQTWAQYTNINFAVVSDNGVASGSGSYEQGDSGNGDIRIGGYNEGSTYLALAYLPPQSNNYSIAGDMAFNTSKAFNIGTTYDLYTAALHEFGHALGLLGSNANAASMYETYSGAKPGLNSDDISGIQTIYGVRNQDAYGGANTSFATAADVTSKISTSTYLALVTNLSLNNSSNAEWFKFTSPSGSNGQLKVTITSTGLSLLDPNVQIYNASNQLLASANAGTYGATIKATSTGSGAGNTLYIKVSSTDAIAAFKTGTYAMAIDLTTGTTQTVPLPKTQTANGSPLTGSGGLADSVRTNGGKGSDPLSQSDDDDEGATGRDTFTAGQTVTAAHTAVRHEAPVAPIVDLVGAVVSATVFTLPNSRPTLGSLNLVERGAGPAAPLSFTVSSVTGAGFPPPVASSSAIGVPGEMTLPGGSVPGAPKNTGAGSTPASPFLRQPAADHEHLQSTDRELIPTACNAYFASNPDFDQLRSGAETSCIAQANIQYRTTDSALAAAMALAISGYCYGVHRESADRKQLSVVQ
jgi:Matrixin